MKSRPVGKFILSRIPNSVRVYFEGERGKSRTIPYEDALLLQDFQESFVGRKPRNGERESFENLAQLGLLSRLTDGTYCLTGNAQRAKYTPINK